MFVEGGLPGEVVRVAIDKERKDLVNAHVVEVINPSPLRVGAPDAMLPIAAGGCEWQFIDPAAQLELKAGIVNDCLTRIAKLAEPPVRFTHSVPALGYRTTMRFGVVEGRLATRRHHSNELVALDRCAVAHPLLEELILEGKFGSADEVTLRVSETTGERMAWIKGDDSNLSLPKDVIVTNDGRNVTFTEEVGGRRWRISAPSFFQSGRDAAELIAKTVDEAVSKDAGWIVDAYAGVGILGGVVAEERDSQLTSVEQSKSAVRDARDNLADLAAEVIEAEVATVSLAGETAPDVVIADPARSGLGPSASRTLADLGAPELILVSCDPASLARDVNLLRDHGYQLHDVEVLDLFPHTHHVETVSTLRLAD